MRRGGTKGRNGKKREGKDENGERPLFSSFANGFPMGRDLRILQEIGLLIRSRGLEGVVKGMVLVIDTNGIFMVMSVVLSSVR